MDVRIAAIVCLLGTATASAAPSPTFESLPLGRVAVVSPSSRTVYIMEPKALVAVDLATGKPRWRSRRAALPLGQLGRALVAADDGGRIVVLDARSGKPAARCATIPGATLQFIDRLGVNVSVSGTSDGTRVFARWSISWHYAGGAAPMPDQRRMERKPESGVYEIDPVRCTATAVTAGPLVPPQHTTDSRVGRIVTTLERPSGESLRISYGTGLVGLQLERWTGTAKPTIVDLSEGVATRLIWSITSDRRYVFVRDQRETAEVTMLDLDGTGNLVHLKLPSFAHASLVVGDLVIDATTFVTAQSLSTGKQRWKREPRVTRYSGPYPP